MDGNIFTTGFVKKISEVNKGLCKLCGSLRVFSSNSSDSTRTSGSKNEVELSIKIKVKYPLYLIYRPKKFRSAYIIIREIS